MNPVLDAIDAIFNARGRDTFSDAADRTTDMFISTMDDLNLRSSLFFIGTSNRFDLVDPAIVRKDRLGLSLEIAATDTNVYTTKLLCSRSISSCFNHCSNQANARTSRLSK